MDGSGMRARVGSLAVAVVLCVGAATAAAPAASGAVPQSVPGQVPTTSQVPTTTLAPAGAAPVTTTAEDPSASGVRIGDPEADRTIRRIVFVLLGLAAFLLLVTIVFWRATRPVAVPLRRLAAMGTRSWRKAGELKRDELLGPAPVRAEVVPGVEVASAIVAAPAEAAPEPVEPEPVAVAAEPADPEPVAPVVAVDGDGHDNDAAPVQAVDGAPAAGEPSTPGASLLADG
jgi:hypothetical protein